MRFGRSGDATITIQRLGLRLRIVVAIGLLVELQPCDAGVIRRSLAYLGVFSWHGPATRKNTQCL